MFSTHPNHLVLRMVLNNTRCRKKINKIMIMLGKSTNEKNIKLKFRSKQNIVKDNMVRKMYKIYSKN